MLNERELENNYPVHVGYLYVVDGHVTRHVSSAIVNVGQLKRELNAKVVTNCDIAGRELWDEMI